VNKNQGDYMSSESEYKTIVFTQSVQNDFINIDSLDSNKIHIGADESKRVNDNLLSFLDACTKVVGNKNIHFVHIRDWHDDTDPEQRRHIEMFDMHCLKGSYGARLFGPLEKFAKEHIESNTILENVINSLVGNESKNNFRIGIIGVWTDVKVMLLAYELSTRYRFQNIVVSPDLCASISKIQHQQGITFMRDILGITVVEKLDEFQKYLNIRF